MADIFQLNLALTSPRSPTYPRFPRGAYWLLNECWATVLYRNLPDPSVVGLLEDSLIAHQNLYATKDDCEVDGLPDTEVGLPHNPWGLELLTRNEIDEAVRVLEGSRYQLASAKLRQFGHRTEHDIVAGELQVAGDPKSLCGIWLDKEFDRLSSWVWELSLVEGSERSKHWPPPHIKSHSELLAHSEQRPKIGWLNLGTSAENLRSFALAAFAAHFRRSLDERTDSIFINERVEDFLISWSEVSERGNFRLGVTHLQTVGVSNGQECRDMVYDFDPSAKQFHCFPVLSFPSVRDTFVEGQLEF